MSTPPEATTGTRPVVLGFDLGGTKLGGLVVDPDGHEPIAEARVPTPAGTDGVVDAVVELAEQLTAAARTATGGAIRVVGAGMGAPGLVDRSGTLRYGANLPGVVDAPLAARIGAVLGVPVEVDNDATCAAWAEFRRGAAAGVNHAVVITLGTGIGAGIIAKGEVLRGANGFGGEPGHMVIDPDGPRCPCGRRGCWERYASGTGLGHLARQAVEAGEAPGLLAVVDGRIAELRGEHVTAAAADGDAGALAVMDRFGWWTAVGVANLVNILDSERVVLGGGLVDAGDVLLDPVRRAYAELVYGADHREPVEILPAALGSRAGAWGAALLGIDRHTALL